MKRSTRYKPKLHRTLLYNYCKRKIVNYKRKHIVNVSFSVVRYRKFNKELRWYKNGMTVKRLIMLNK